MGDVGEGKAVSFQTASGKPVSFTASAKRKPKKDCRDPGGGASTGAGTGASTGGGTAGGVAQAKAKAKAKGTGAGNTARAKASIAGAGVTAPSTTALGAAAKAPRPTKGQREPPKACGKRKRSPRGAERHTRAPAA